MKRHYIATALVAVALPASGLVAPHAGAAAHLCEQLPVTVPGITIVGHRIQQVSQVEVCVENETSVSAIPSVRLQPGCGDPCFTIDVNEASLSQEATIQISYALDGVPQDPLVVKTNRVDLPVFQGRMCLVGVGTPDPCIDRIIAPADLAASGAKRKVHLKWGASEDTGGAPLEGYEIYRSRSGLEGSFSLVGTASETTYVDNGLKRGRAYCYYVVAFDGDGNRSAPSNTAKARVR